MQDWIIGIINQYGYFGIALLIAVENIFPPIPSEVILTFSGFMTTVTDLKIWGVVLSATIGSVLGAVVLYSVGRLMSPQRLERLLGGKLGRVLHLKREDVHHAGAWFARRGKFTVFFCRFIPVVRSLISIPAGMAKMRMGMFLLLTALGTFLWNVVLVYLGAFFGASWETVVRYVDTYSMAAIAVVAVSLVVFCAWYFFRRSKRR
ncbi:DedA family protein [Clostridium sp. KNHs216]|uniref:DedA family protein n=1 Tax=Eubacteriales TaxID=186802 RepID=UPI00056FB0DD|nr:DedA family protein [Clostridium sp. KNHs216]MBE6831044.1 DedA family protein [Oscillospiraceae bacterium]TQI66494.1 membrane protein DedA with SNARE-associated domain [Clostridium sp. KNHs216]